MSEGTGETGERGDPRTEPAKPSTPAPSGGTDEQRVPQTQAAEAGLPMPGDPGVTWVRIAPSQVMRTVAIALLTAAVVLGALFLIWQVRTFIGWFVIALFLA